MNNQKLFGRGVLLAVVAGLFAAGTVQAASYTNTASGNWTDSTKWNTSGIGVSGADTIIVFNPGGAVWSTNNNAGAFSLNQLLVVPNYTVNLYPSGGSSLNFVTSSGSTLPAIANNGANPLAINSPITLATNLTVSSASSGAITINSTITESAMSDIIKLGANTLTLTASNTFTGNLYIKAGTLANSSSGGDNGNFGPATSTIYLGDATAAATLEVNGTGVWGTGPNFSNPINVVSGEGTRTISGVVGSGPYINGAITLNNNLKFLFNNGNNSSVILKIGGNITGTGNITFASTSGYASIQITGASINPVGAITNSCLGTNAVSISGAIGTNVTAVVQNSTSSGLTLSGNNTYSNTIVQAGTLYLTGSNAFTGNIYIKAGTLTDQTGGNYGDTRNWGPPTATIYLGDVNGSADATLATASNAGYNGPASSINPIIVQGGTGARIIRVQAGVTSKSWIGGDITLNNNLQFIYDRVGGVDLRISGNITGTGNLTFASTLGSGPIQLTGASINPVGIITNSSLSTGASTISGAIGANVTAVVQNSATSALTLSGTNTYTGPTVILAGSLTLSGSGPLGNGAYAGDITNAGTLVYNSTATQTLSGVISGSGTLTQSRGVLLINNIANTFNGATTVGAGATLGGAGTIAGTVSVASGALLAPSLGTGGSNTLSLGSALTLNGGPCLKFALSSPATNDQININGGLTLNSGNYITLTCPGGGNINQGTYTLMTYTNKLGSGTLALNTTISNASLNVTSTDVSLIVSNGGITAESVASSTLTWKGNLSGIWDASNLNWTNMAGSAVAYVQGNAVTFDDIGTTLRITNGVDTLQPGSVTFNASKNYTNGANIGGTGYLLKNNSGTVMLTGTNTYTGPTLISAGAATLTIGGAGQLGGGSNYTGAITHNGAGLTFASSAPNTLSGGITGTGTVTKSGSGDLTIAGTNSIGALTLSAGTTVIANTTTLSTLATVGNVANSPATLILSNGTVTGITTLTVGNIANANTNGVRVTGGSLLEVNTSITMGNASSKGNYVTNFGGILQFITSTPTITITNYPANALVITNGTVSFRGVNTTPVNLTNNWVNSGIGTNTVIWGGNNTLRLNGSTATNTLGRPYEFNTGFGPTNYVNLELLGTSAIRGGGVTIGAAGSMLVSNGTVNITGTLTNDNGTVTLAGRPAVLMATNTFYNNGLLTGSGTVSGLVTVGSAGILSPGGSNGIGTLTFSTNVVFNGGTNILTFTSSTNDQIQVLGTISGTNYLQIVPSPPGATLPENGVLFTFTTKDSATYIRSITDGYAVTLTPSNVTLRASSRGCLMIIK